MLTTAVFAICLTAPLGAIFINTLGTKWLSYDGDVDMNVDEEDEFNAKEDDKQPEKEPNDGLETDRQFLKVEPDEAPVGPIIYDI